MATAALTGTVTVTVPLQRDTEPLQNLYPQGWHPVLVLDPNNTWHLSLQGKEAGGHGTGHSVPR